MVKRVWKAARLGELVKWGTGSGGSERTFAGNEPPNKPIDPRIVYPWMVLQIDKRQWRIDCITGNIEIPEPALRRATNTRTSYHAPLESGSSFDIPLTLDLWRKFGTRRENETWREFFSVNFLIFEYRDIYFLNFSANAMKFTFFPLSINWLIKSGSEFFCYTQGYLLDKG